MGRRPNPNRRVELLAEIVTYVQANGLANLSLRPLAGALGTSTYTLTYQFGNKSEILRSIVDALAEDESNAPYARPGLSTEEVLEAYWADVKDPDRLAFHRTMIERATVASLEGLSQEKMVVSAPRQVLFESMQGDGLATEEADVQASLVWAAAQGLAMHYIASGDTDGLDRAAAALSRMVAGTEPIIDLQDAPAINLSSTSSGLSETSRSNQ
ncbi:MAG: TetR/AcrR family transcriptional regulator [Acidimicrobiales bacterium]|nr:TetR/AcrR family transcriptional regulator [Acidimicrobiales bacterium]